jgi:hypothetical protein
LARHSNAISAIGEVFKQNAMFKWWVKIVTKYSDADECLFCGDTVLELQYALADWSTKWLNKDRYPSLWGIFVSVFGQLLGSQLVRHLNRTKCNRCDTLTAFYFWVLMDSG